MEAAAARAVAPTSCATRGDCGTGPADMMLLGRANAGRGCIGVGSATGTGGAN